MKKILFSLFLYIPFVGFSQQDSIITDDDHPVFAKVEQESAYPGGIDGWRNYLISNMRYPPKAVRKKIEGTVVVQFIVDKKGNVTFVEAIEGPALLKKEAVRLIEASGRWMPAQQSGRAVKSYKKQPFVFKLQE